ncbi:MAG TPA: hypothetical protein VEC12_09025 [Bacteroidia bacterium]|nr:hypothetical protein [Bacteroidia bacterium]
MKRIVYNVLKFTYRLVIFLLLTLVTQVGGIIYLVSLLPFLFITIKNRWLLRVSRVMSFIILYTVCSLWIIPALAKANGRVTLPVRSNPYLKPAVPITWLFNRHYVKPGLKALMEQESREMTVKYDGLITFYLEANFPFFNGYPLWPHITHDDGNKLDLAFYYTKPNAGAQQKGSPSIIGYGVCEPPKPGEINLPEKCEDEGHWKYNFMSKYIPQGKKKDFVFDEDKTKELLNRLAKNGKVRMIFIEPHLKQRFKVKDAKVRMHGCWTVRHDDHIHISVR